MKGSLADRMKDYEKVLSPKFTKKVPVIIRLDGKAFHSFTIGFRKPFDMVLRETMGETSKYLCENIQGCKLAYTQSDEISLLLTDYETIYTNGWFDYEVEKIISISASMATLAFNKCLVEVAERYLDNGDISVEEFEFYKKKSMTALFDSRGFNIPKEDVVNYFIWRQQDATRNSIFMVGRANFSHKQLECKNINQIQDMLFIEKGINWNNFEVYNKRGLCVKRRPVEGTLRRKWKTDFNIPIFTQDRSYIEELI